MRTLMMLTWLAAAPFGAAPQDASVWAVDLVRTKPELRADYLEYVSANWVPVREEMKRHGAVSWFRVLTAPADKGGGWDVMLVTEYPSRAAYDAREASYEKAVARTRGPGQGPRLIRGRGARELAEITGSYALDTFEPPRR